MDRDTERALVEAGYGSLPDYVENTMNEKKKPKPKPKGTQTQSGGNGPRPKEK